MSPPNPCASIPSSYSLSVTSAQQTPPQCSAAPITSKQQFSIALSNHMVSCAHGTCHAASVSGQSNCTATERTNACAPGDSACFDAGASVECYVVIGCDAAQIEFDLDAQTKSVTGAGIALSGGSCVYAGSGAITGS